MAAMHRAPHQLCCEIVSSSRCLCLLLHLKELDLGNGFGPTHVKIALCALHVYGKFRKPAKKLDLHSQIRLHKVALRKAILLHSCCLGRRNHVFMLQAVDFQIESINHQNVLERRQDTKWGVCRMDETHGSCLFQAKGLDRSTGFYGRHNP